MSMRKPCPVPAALKRFLDQRADILRDKKLIVFAFNAPYFLSDTEIGKLTAYYGLYSKVRPSWKRPCARSFAN